MTYAGEDTLVGSIFNSLGVKAYPTADQEHGQRYHHFTPGQVYSHNVPRWINKKFRGQIWNRGVNHSSVTSVAFHKVTPTLMRRFHALLYDLCPENTNIVLNNNSDYQPAPIEQYVIDNAVRLGLDATAVDATTAPSCAVLKNKTISPHYDTLHQYIQELQQYSDLVEKFQPVKDLRRRLDPAMDVCQTVELHRDGLQALFPSGQLSLDVANNGYMEPLLPPLRHPLYCLSPGVWQDILRLDYLVHDFGALCRKLKPTSRTVFIDMGASLQFHGRTQSPAVHLVELFRKFGVPFDHIYAYEQTQIKPDQVFQKVPDHLRAAYHWINVGVDADPNSSLNPLKMLLENYDKDDLVVIKLDIDHSSIELPLAMQLLEDERYSGLVDHFYFEHHVNQLELKPAWDKDGMEGSIQESLQLFQGLRKKGIAAHYWV